MKKHLHIRFDTGFTLVELLVAIAVSGIVLAGLVQVLMTANRSYTHQDEMATLQQNLRIAKMDLERDVRVAGCGFGNAFYYLGNPVFPMDNTDGGTTGADSLTISYVDYDASCNGALPPLTPTAITPISITVTPPTNPPYTTSWTAGVPDCAVLPFLAVYTYYIPSTNSSLPPSMYSYVFTVTSVPNATTLNCSSLPINAIPSTSTNNTINFFSATQLVTVTYSLDSVNCTLIRNQQPANINGVIAENIEDLQFAFGLDTTGGGTVDTWVNDAVLSTTQKTQIRLVRISIVGRSSDQLSGQSLNTRPLVEDHAAGTVSDKYLREQLQFEVTPRNING